jgi:hypothetical protein
MDKYMHIYSTLASSSGGVFFWASRVAGTLKWTLLESRDMLTVNPLAAGDNRGRRGGVRGL